MSIFKSLIFAGLAATVSIVNAEPHCPGNLDSLRLRLIENVRALGDVGRTPGPAGQGVGRRDFADSPQAVNAD